MDKHLKKLKLLQELDSETDWEAAIRKEQMEQKAVTSCVKSTSAKLSKSQKKRLKLEKQREKFEELLKEKNVETFVYSNPDAISTKQNKRNNITDQPVVQNSTNTTSSTPGIDIDMRKTRFEIMKFGMNSLKAKDLENAETSLAISLGAKPSRKPAINYKDLQAQRKKERESEKEETSKFTKPNLKTIMKKTPRRNSAGKVSKRETKKQQVGIRKQATNRHSNFQRNRKNRK